MCPRFAISSGRSLDDPALSSAERPAPWAWLGLLVLTLALAVPDTRAQGCGPTLTSITLDGEFDDWVPVLTNPANVSFDSDGSSLPCGVSLDRDCTITNAPLDLRAFATTWDDQNLYFYLERFVPTRESMLYWIYLDRDDDQLFSGGPAGVGDLRIHLNWLSVFSSYQVEVAIENFLTGGVEHPMVDGSSLSCGPTGDQACADGHSVGGSTDRYSRSAGVSNCLTGTCARATRLEVAIRWDQLGLVPGTPLSYHVAASAPGGAWPDSIEDNLAGPNGGPGSTGFNCHAIGPDLDVSVDDGHVAVLAHRLDNLGNREDRHDIWAVSRIGWPLRILGDPDGDGDAEEADLLAVDFNGDGDFTDLGDYLDPLADTNGDGRPELGPLSGGSGTAIGGSAGLVVEVATSGSPGEAQRDRIEVFARSHASLDVRSTVDVLRVSRISVFPDQERSIFSGPEPRIVPYPLSIRSWSFDPDVGVRSSESTAGWTTRIYSDPDCDGDRSDGLDMTETLDIPPTSLTCVVAEVEVPADTPDGTVDVTVIEAGSGNSVGAVLMTTVEPSIELRPSHTVDNGLVKYGAPLGSVFFAHQLVNNTEDDDRFNISHLSDLGFGTALYTDPDGDGNPADGELISDGSLSPPIAAYGGVLPLVLRVDIGDVPPGVLELTELFAVSDNTDEFRTVADETLVGNLISFEDSGHLLQATVFAPCETIHARAVGLEESQPERYQLLWLDPDDRVLRRTVLSSDARGEADDALELSLGDLDGEWTLALRTCSLPYIPAGACPGVESEVETITVVVDNPTTLDELSTVQSTHANGDRVSATTVLRNDSEVAALTGTRVELVVMTPSQDLYLDGDGVFQPVEPGVASHVRTDVDAAPGESVRVEFERVVPLFPEDADDYLLRVRWIDPCGAILLLSDHLFAVETVSEECGNGIDDDGDGLTDCEDSDCDAVSACQSGLAVSRSVLVTPAGYHAALASVLDPGCAAPLHRLCLDGPDDERILGSPDGLRLVDEALSDGTPSLWLYEHSDDVIVELVRDGDDLVFTTR
ncbi:MAG: hypothetical protein AAF533_12815 [Acidobacteriota bacterium]